MEQEELGRFYNKKSARLHPEFMVFHDSEDTSSLFFKIDASELLFTRKDHSGAFKARLSLDYELTQDRDGKEELILRDSLRFNRQREELENTELIGQTKLKGVKGVDEAMLKVKLKDLNRKNSMTEMIRFKKKGRNSRQDFLIVDPSSGRPCFNDHFEKGRKVKVRTGRFEPDTLFSRFYLRDFPLPPPPFAMDRVRSFDFGADSLSIESRNDPDGFMIEIPNDGFGHYRIDTTDKKGLSIFNFTKGYPRITTVDAMLPPLRYLTSKKEFTELKSAENTKEAIDDFWLELGGNKERAKRLIKTYYGRVETANRFFTSYVEGWKTDRGLIYVIFGGPNSIKKSRNGETWVYGEENNLMSLTFSFSRVKNPFSDNDMTLSRNQLYKTSWYRAVESWRNGKVYSN